MPRTSNPNPTVAQGTPVDRLALAIAGHGFASGLPLPTAPVSDAIFAPLLAIGTRDRLLGAMAELVATGLLPVTDDQRIALTHAHSGWLHHSLRVERLLMQVVDCFERSAIEVRVLKGIALAHLVYDDPSWRVSGDLDLLIRSEQFDDAVRLACNELGGVAAIPELRPGFDREFGKEALIRIGGIELDLHRTFVSGPFGLSIDLDSLFEGASPLEIGGIRFEALDPTSLFLHACYNLALGDYPVRLCSLRDLMLAHQKLDLNITTIETTAEAWCATGVLRLAAQLAVDAFALPPHHELRKLALLPVPRKQAWLLRSYLTPGRSYSRQLASFAEIRGAGARLRYARALLMPSADYLKSRGWTTRSHLVRARDRLLRHG